MRSQDAGEPSWLAPTTEVGKMVDHLFRNRAGQMVAYLARWLGPEHLDLAEEVVQEALLKALQHWPYNGVPQNPAGWLFRVARNAALDAVRRNIVFSEKAPALVAEFDRGAIEAEPDDAVLESQLRDDELRMIFMCCHPTIPRDARVALSLKTVCGFSTREIARAFLADEVTVAQRLFRAKRQMRDAGLPLDLPAGNELAQRLDSVLEVIYLLFNEGYAAHQGEDLIRRDLCYEGLRLGRLVAESSAGTPKAHALVALMAFQAARLPARVDDSGDLVLFEDQHRGRWDKNLIGLGFHHFERCAEGTEMTEYHLQAAIAAVYAQAEDPQRTDWHAILTLYDQFMEFSPSPVVALNRAVALAKIQGAKAALDAIAPLARDASLRNYYLLPAVRGRLLLDLGERDAAAACFREALERPCSEPERRFLRRRLAECTSEA